MINSKNKREKRCGFSLLELLAVISIMALLSTMAVTSYFSAVRGMAFRSAKRHFLNALDQAHQRACMDGVRVSLVAFNEPVTYDVSGADVKEFAACYVVCREIGRISFASQRKGKNYLFDEFSDLGKLFPVPRDAQGAPVNVSNYSEQDWINVGLLRLYNLSKGGYTQVRPYAEEDEVGKATLLYSGGTPPIRAHALVVEGMEWKGKGKWTWAVGDAYGVEVSPVQSLPKKYEFEELDKDNMKGVICVTFEPDGSRSSNDKKFTIKDGPLNTSNKSLYEIDADGTIRSPE